MLRNQVYLSPSLGSWHHLEIFPYGEVDHLLQELHLNESCFQLNFCLYMTHMV